ncbi:hypothetical protein EDC01DRAFT_137514 [Geopyxis carbonaria]|nr:hypothetical protein EDC01DRAFT_137514 [Geopyxis carbonaria]
MSSPNLSLLTETLSVPLLLKSLPPASDATATDASDLHDFTAYLASTLFASLPGALQAASSTSLAAAGPALLDLTRYPPNALAPSECLDSLISYDLADDADSATRLLMGALEAYLAAATAPPPAGRNTRVKECEICERDVPLSYHHLVPRSVHAKVLKRGWHTKERLESVAWLCRPCHDTVHRCASNEELAREWYTVELLMGREDVQRWAAYVGRQKGRKGCSNAPRGAG